MSLSRTIRFVLPVAVLALMFAACNGTEAEGDGGTPGGGDFEVTAGARYGDTSYTPGSRTFAPIDTLFGTNSSNWRVDTIGYTVTGAALVYKVGDSTKNASFGSSVQVGVGVKNPVSATYNVRGHDADPRTPRSGMSGTVRIYVVGLTTGLAWSHPDSTVGAKVKVVVTGDSVQVIGKNIKLSSGKLLSFNFKARKPY